MKEEGEMPAWCEHGAFATSDTKTVGASQAAGHVPPGRTRGLHVTQAICGSHDYLFFSLTRERRMMSMCWSIVLHLVPHLLHLSRPSPRRPSPSATTANPTLPSSPPPQKLPHLQAPPALHTFTWTCSPNQSSSPPALRV